MFKSKEESKLLSDEEFERIGRRKKTVISIIIFMIILVVSLLTFKFIKKDNNINVKQPEVMESSRIEAQAADEAADLKKDITDKTVTEELCL